MEANESCSAHPFTEPFFHNIRVWSSVPWFASSLCIASTVTSEIVVKLFSGLNAVPMFTASEWRLPSTSGDLAEACNPSLLSGLKVWSRCCQRAALVDDAARNLFANGLLSAIAESFGSQLHRPECCWARQGWRLLGRPRNNVLVDLVTRPVCVDRESQLDSSATGSDWRLPIGCSAAEIQSRTEVIRSFLLFGVTPLDPPQTCGGGEDVLSLATILAMLGFDDGTAMRWAVAPGDDGTSEPRRAGRDTEWAKSVDEVPWEELPDGLRELVPRPLLVCHYCGAIPPLIPFGGSTPSNEEEEKRQCAPEAVSDTSAVDVADDSAPATPAVTPSECLLSVSASIHKVACPWKNNFLSAVMVPLEPRAENPAHKPCSAKIPIARLAQLETAPNNVAHLHLRIDESSDTADFLVSLHREFLNSDRPWDSFQGNACPLRHPLVALANHASCVSHFAVSTLPNVAEGADTAVGPSLSVQIPPSPVERALLLSTAVVHQQLLQHHPHHQRNEGQDSFPFRNAYIALRRLLFAHKRPRSEDDLLASTTAEELSPETSAATAAIKAYQQLRSQTAVVAGRGGVASSVAKKTVQGKGTREERLLDCLRSAVCVHGSLDALPTAERDKVDSCVVSVAQALEVYLKQPPPLAKPSAPSPSAAAPVASTPKKSAGLPSVPQRAPPPVHHHHHQHHHGFQHPHHHHHQQHNYRNMHQHAAHIHHHGTFPQQPPLMGHAQYGPYPPQGIAAPPQQSIFVHAAAPPPAPLLHQHHHHLMAPPPVLAPVHHLHQQSGPSAPPFTGGGGAPGRVNDSAHQRSAPVLPANQSSILPSATVTHGGRPLSANAPPFQPTTQVQQQPAAPTRLEASKSSARPAASPQPRSQTTGPASALLAAPSVIAAPVRGTRGKAAAPNRGNDRGGGGMRQPVVSGEQARPQQPAPKHVVGKPAEAPARGGQQQQQQQPPQEPPGHPQQFRGRGGGGKRGRNPRGQ